jgi:hypothetical protein
MRRLEDVSLGHRIVATVIICLIVLFILALIGWLSGGWDESSDGFVTASADEPLIASKYDDRIIELDKEAVDNAYVAQVQHLIATWFRDDTGQPTRALKGVGQARKAYIDMQRAIEKREADLRKLQELKQ